MRESIGSDAVPYLAPPATLSNVITYPAQVQATGLPMPAAGVSLGARTHVNSSEQPGECPRVRVVRHGDVAVAYVVVDVPENAASIVELPNRHTVPVEREPGMSHCPPLFGVILYQKDDDGLPRWLILGHSAFPLFGRS